MQKVQIFAWCTLSAMIGFSAAQFAPSLRSGRASQARPPTKALNSADSSARIAPNQATPPAASVGTAKPTVAPRPFGPTAPRQTAQVIAASPAPAPPAPATRASLLSSFRFAGIGAHGGVRLGRVTPGSLPALLGLKTGDEIITLNGLRISDPQKAMQAYAQLPYVDSWIARIHRDGVQTELRYALR
jgi:S1-C subfamily serine protease